MLPLLLGGIVLFSSAVEVRSQGVIPAHDDQFYQKLLDHDFEGIGASQGAALDAFAIMMGFQVVECPQPGTVTVPPPMPSDQELEIAWARIVSRYPAFGVFAGVQYGRHEHFLGFPQWIDEHGCNSQDTVVLASNLMHFFVWLGKKVS